MLIAAAAAQWGVPAGECATADGAVTHEGKILPFGGLAAAAAERDPAQVVARGPGKLAGQDLPRLDLPPKSDGSLRFAADVRLPGMVFASLRMAPPGVGAARMVAMILIHPSCPTQPEHDRLAYAREIVRAEAAALETVAERLDASFVLAVDLIHRCPGRIAVTGTGKSADVGQKIVGARAHRV